MILRQQGGSSIQEFIAGIKVGTFADLPAAGGINVGKMALVLSNSGVWLVNYKSKGIYYSDGTTWAYKGDYEANDHASEIGATASGNLAGATVEAQLTELDAEKALLAGSPTQAFAASSLTTPIVIGGSSTTQAVTYKTTTGIGAAGADHIFQVGNNGATEAVRILNNGNVGIGKTNPSVALDVVGAISATGAISGGAGSFTTLSAAGNVTITGANALRGSYGGGGVTSNFAAGDGALLGNTTGIYNMASGLNALYSNTTGIYNMASGVSALFSNTTGSNNTASGVQALQNNTTGSNNTASGVSALYDNTTGNDNTASGYAALYEVTAGIHNVGIGSSAGRGITTGNNNTIIGSRVTGLAAALEKNIILASGDGVAKYQHNGSAAFFKQLAPAAINATATATIANLLTQIVTSTSAAVTDITLPTGTLMDGALISSLDMAFNWTIINTGPSAVNILAGVDHTIVGAAGTATLTSSNWCSRRTAANVWVTYRI